MAAPLYARFPGRGVGLLVGACWRNGIVQTGLAVQHRHFSERVRAVSADAEGCAPLNPSGQPSMFRTEIQAGRHRLVADEPLKVGGADEGPNPYDLVLSALGACTSMTLKMYAARKKLPLEGVTVELSHAKVYAKDCEDCGEKATAGQIDRIERNITIHGDDLTEEQRKRLLEIANMCPVHRTLERSAVVVSKLVNEARQPTLDLIFRGRGSTIGPGFDVLRLLPFRRKRSMGNFVFLDHMGPAVLPAGSTGVGPHPHIGLCTLTYLFKGQLLHRDSTGAEQVVMPGQVNLMVSGRGVVHSERLAKTANADLELHGLQLWLALPKEEQGCEPAFHHLQELPTIFEGEPGVQARLVLGSVAGQTSPVPAPGAGTFMIDVDMEEGSVLRVPLQPNVEVAVYPAEGKVVSGAEMSDLTPGMCAAYHPVAHEGESFLEVKAVEKSRVALLGGLPLPEKREMWWNFVHTDAEEIKKAAERWRAQDKTAFPTPVHEPDDEFVPAPEPRG